MQHFWRLIVIACLLVSQTVMSVHATEFGDEHHQHDGVECVMAFAAKSPGDDLDVPPSTTPLILHRLESATAQFVLEGLLVPTVTVLPPGRAPPLH